MIACPACAADNPDGARWLVAPHDPADVYDYAGGRPTLLSAGFLLETLRIAASYL